MDDFNLDSSFMFDPSYQNNLFLIEDALRALGQTDTSNAALPDIFDEQLRALIEAVPLE